MKLRDFLAIAKRSMLQSLDEEKGWTHEDEEYIKQLTMAIDYCGHLEAEGRSRES